MRRSLISQSRWLAGGAVGALALAVALGTAGCGSSGNGTGGSGSSTISGNVDDTTTASLEQQDQTFLAWMQQRMLTWVQTAHAQNPGEGIEVCARSQALEACDVTDANGDFVIPNAPSGDVTLAFNDDRCQASFELPDVVNNSNVQVIDFDCAQGRPARTEETFDAIVRNAPQAPQAAFNVCVERAENDNRNRVVKSATNFEDSSGQEGERPSPCAGEAPVSFADLANGDLVTVVGTREGADPQFRSAVDASCVDIRDRGLNDPCGDEQEAEGEENGEEENGEEENGEEENGAA